MKGYDMKKELNLDQAGYKKLLESDEVALVDFWAPWCGPCKAQGPIVEKLAEDFSGKAGVYKVNVDENPEIAAELGIRGIPSLVVLKKGEVVEFLVGLRREAELKEILEKHTK